MASAAAQAQAPAVRPARTASQRAVLALGLCGLVLTTLAVWVVLGYLGPLFQILYGLWGLLGLVLALLGVLCAFAAFLAFLLTGRRAEPRFEAGASIESLQTQQR